MDAIELMTAEECYERASECAAKASLARGEPIAHEFIKLAAQWRTMATRMLFLGSITDAVDALVIPEQSTAVEPIPIGLVKLPFAN